jgi:tetratricopeptide (TPR) repeat protein/predicted AlkP superfamily pyrophosphatase or phosphodiesterase
MPRRRLLLFALLLAGLALPAWPSAAPAPPAGPPPARILLIGLDAADWQIAGPLIDSGRLPHLARLRREGAWTDLRSTTPMLSPLLWTSLATGKTPGEHGIIDFLVTDPRTGRKVPIASTFRKTKAIWNILSEQGRTADFIGWWATWPAESINGHMVSDRFAYSLFGYQQSAQDLVGIASPEPWIRTILPLRVSEDAITLQDLQRFAAVSAADFAAARERLARDPRQSYADPLNHLMKILASTRTYHALAMNRLRSGKPDVLSVYYQGIDEVGHRFGHYLPPKLPWVEAASYEKYHDVVTRFYEYQDELLGELLAAAGPGMTVVVLSDHGFLSGSDRPDVPPDNEAKAGLWHRLYGILVMAGPGIRPGRMETVSLYDVTPTLLHLSGLPVAADMAGKPILDALTADFQAANKLTTVATYEDPAGARAETAGSLPGSSAAIDEEILARLKSLGYIAATDIDNNQGSASTPPTVNNLINGAALHLSQGRADAAEAVLRQALAETPKNATARSMLSEALESLGRLEESALEARTALNLMAEPQERLVERFASLARRLSRLDECKAFFLRYAQQRPGRAEPWLGLGFAQSMAGDMKGAEASFLRALEMNPRSVAAVTGLYNVYERGERSREILQAVRAAVEANPDSSAHHTLLGMFLVAERDTRGAEAELRRALELDPDRDAALAALGDLLLATGRGEESRRLLEKAIARSANLIEVRLSLGRVYAKMGRMGEATRQMSEAVRLDPRSATAHGQLGMILVMQERHDRAVPMLERALELDPDLYELRLHLAVQYHSLKKPEACEAVLRAALSRRPGEPEATRLLASLYRETGRQAEAERLLAQPPTP